MSEIIKKADSLRTKFITDSLGNYLESEVLRSKYERMLKILYDNIIQRKISFFTIKICENVYKNPVEDVIPFAQTRMEHTLENIPEVQYSQKFSKIVTELRSKPDILVSATNTLLKTRPEFSDQLFFSTIPSLFNFFITHDQCILFKNFINRLLAINKDAAYKACRCVFLTPEFASFMKTILNEIPINIASISSPDEAASFYESLRDEFEKHQNEIGFFAKIVLNRVIGQEILLNSFLLPSAYNPALYGLSAPEEVTSQATTRNLLDVIENGQFASSILSTIPLEDVEYDDVFSEVMSAIPSYAESLIFTRDDVTLINLISALYINKNERLTDIPEITNKFECVKVKIASQHYTVEKNSSTLFERIPPIVGAAMYEMNENFIDVYQKDAIPYAFSFEKFGANVSVSLLKEKAKHPNFLKSGIASGIEVSSIVHVSDLLEREVALNNEQMEICVMRKFVLNIMYAGLYFKFKEPISIGNELYKSPKAFAMYLKKVDTDANAWISDKVKNVQFAVSTIMCYILMNFDFNKVKALYPWLDSLQDVAFKEETINMIDQNDKTAQYMKKFPDVFDEPIKLIRTAFEIKSINSMVRMISKAINMLKPIILKKSSGIKEFGGDEFIPCFIQLILMAKPKNFFVRVVSLYAIFSEAMQLYRESDFGNSFMVESSCIAAAISISNFTQYASDFNKIIKH